MKPRADLLEDDEAARRRDAAVERLLDSRVDQGLPRTVEDPGVLARVVVLVESPIRSEQVASS